MIWHHVVTAPNRWMAVWLRRQGWACVYLEAPRRCGPGSCWLQLYEASRAADGRRRRL